MNMKTKPATAKSFILKFRIFVFLGLAISLFIAQPALAEEALSDDWGFSVSVYGWGTGLEAETAEGDDIDITFKDILENLTLSGPMLGAKFRF